MSRSIEVLHDHVTTVASVSNGSYVAMTGGMSSQDGGQTIQNVGFLETKYSAFLGDENEILVKAE